jgi:tRNA threonylcarbamoyl adenosine modification protein YeaZ
MSLTLIINTAVEPFGFSLFLNDRVLVSIKQSFSRSFSESLLGLIDCHCQENGLSISKISAIGVVNGPGSYTGIRIGVSYAKSLAMTLGCPVVAISSLEALAYQCVVRERLGAIVMPARPSYVYFQLFNYTNEMHPVSELMMISYEQCTAIFDEFESPLDVYLATKVDGFELYENPWIYFFSIDIDCSKLGALINQKIEVSSETSYRNIALNYVCEPKIGA